jgi:hypothetical protein
VAGVNFLERLHKPEIKDPVVDTALPYLNALPLSPETCQQIAMNDLRRDAQGKAAMEQAEAEGHLHRHPFPDTVGDIARVPGMRLGNSLAENAEKCFTGQDIEDSRFLREMKASAILEKAEREELARQNEARGVKKWTL